MYINENRLLEHYRHKALKAARDLRYSQEIIDQIESADSVGRIEQLMVTGRKQRFKD